MKYIHTTSFADIGYDKEGKTLIVVWKNQCDPNEYKGIYNIVLDIITKTTCSSLINDISHQGNTDIDNKKWLQNEFIPQSVTRGLVRIATVMKPSDLEQFYLDSIIRTALSKNNKLRLHYNRSLRDAYDWVVNEQALHAA